MSYPIHHPWHHVAPHPQSPKYATALIEIKKGSRAKYEIDKTTGLLRLDRVLLPSMMYPTNYGFIPRTYAADRDPLDILVLSQVNMEPLAITEAVVIGMMHMVDNGEDDEKIIAVAATDISVNSLRHVDEMPEYLRNEIYHFFSNYKTLEGKEVTLRSFEGPETAWKVIDDAFASYNAEIAPQVAAPFGV